MMKISVFNKRQIYDFKFLNKPSYLVESLDSALEWQ